MASPYELDIAEQPEALRRFAASDLPDGLSQLRLSDYARIVITGMGSSHFAGLPTWRRLIAAGLPAWWISSTELLDSPELLTAETLLVATSQSGRSGEVVALLEYPVKHLIGIADDEASPLAHAADVHIPLLSGPEATVSSKSYLNTVAAHRRLAITLLGKDRASLDREIQDAADSLEKYQPPTAISAAAERLASGPDPRMAVIGKKDDAAAALLAGLILKEAAKVPAEGYIGGAFRHGPLEMAGPGLTAVILADPERTGRTESSLGALAEELLEAHSDVVLVGGSPIDGATHIAVPTAPGLVATVIATRIIQQLSVEVAYAKNLVPGQFRYGQKITSDL